MRIPFGSAHGRFQPLHNDHVKYLLESKNRCDFLWVGITQFNIQYLDCNHISPHRSERSENPLTFFERYEIIRDLFRHEGICHDEYCIIPFPLDAPHCLIDFLPNNIPIFTTICDEWNEYKIDLLTDYGYKVIVLWKHKQNPIKGVDIRFKIINGDNSWRIQVPSATIKMVEKINLKERLIELKEQHTS